MTYFNVSVRTEIADFKYTALATCAADAVCDAVDIFGVCAVTVTV
jgi:hypothetical protein